MPRTRLDADNRPRQEKLGVLITGTAVRQGPLGKTVANAIGSSIPTALKRMEDPGELTVNELVKLAKRLGIPADEVRVAIRF